MRIGPFVVPRMFAVHGAAALVGIVIVVMLLRGALIGETVASCSDRFNNGTVYGLETRNGLLSPGELQAGLAGRDFGVMENLDIITFNSSTAKAGLRVRLAALGTSSTSDARIDNGIDFGWAPKKMPNARVACLSYNVRLPADFKHGDGGRLPSLIGAPSDAAGDQRTIAAQLIWTQGGNLSLDIKSEAPDDGSISATAVHSDARLPTGVWARIDQEVVLNTPGEADGEIRLWVDGALMINRDGLLFRRDPKTFLNGVAVTVAYAGSRSETASAQPAAIDVSPFEIRWPDPAR